MDGLIMKKGASNEAPYMKTSLDATFAKDTYRPLVFDILLIRYNNSFLDICQSIITKKLNNFYLKRYIIYVQN